MRRKNKIIMTSSVIVLNATNNVLLDSPTSLIDNGVVDDEHISQVNNNVPHYPQFNNLKKLFCQNNNTATGYEIFVILLLLVLLSSVKFYKIYRQNVRRTV
jgi:hypothetical protein